MFMDFLKNGFVTANVSNTREKKLNEYKSNRVNNEKTREKFVV